MDEVMEVAEGPGEPHGVGAPADHPDPRKNPRRCVTMAEAPA
jgi:hypothetical protein